VRYVYCHPLFEERKCSHRFSYQLKRAFKEAGLMLERFDYRGTGEAEGEFSEVSIVSLREDVARQIQGEELCLIGLRFGASLALDYCVSERAAIEVLVLIEPIIIGSSYVDFLRRKQRIKDLITGLSGEELVDDGFENIEGYKTSRKFIRQLQGFNLLETAERYGLKNPVYIVRLSGLAGTDAETHRLAEILRRSAADVTVENIEMPPFWERISGTDYSALTGKILRWCRG